METTKKKVLYVGNRAHYETLKEDRGAWSVWEASFAENTDQALRALQSSKFEVVVSDDLSSRSDALFLETRDKFPDVVRLALGDRSSSVPARPPERVSYWPVPRACDARSLASLLERSMSVQRRIGGDGVRAFVGDLSSLPPVPSVYVELQRIVGRPDTTVDLIAKTIESDPGLAMRVLQVVNSVSFGLRQRVSSIHQAVSLLGAERIKGTVLTAKVFESAEGTANSGLSMELFQKYAVRVARLAQQFMKSRGLGEEAFTAGLLHDVGKIVLAMRQPELFSQLLLRVAETSEDQAQVERELFGVTHSEAGAHLLSSWGIPFPIVECVAFHHISDQMDHGPLVAAVHAADALWEIYGCGESEDCLNVAALERAGVLGDLDEWRRIAKESLP